MNDLACAVYCLANSDFGKAFFVFGSGTVLAFLGYATARNAMRKVRFYVFANAFASVNVPAVYFSMSCGMLWFLKYYFVYALAFLAFVLTFPRAYKLYLRRRYGFGVDRELASRHGLKKVFVLNTTLPKAFAVGGDIFLSEGLLELLNEDELSAVIYHEKYHATRNRFLPLRAMGFLTFFRIPEEDAERAADEYAEGFVGKDPLLRAKRKLEKFYS